MSPDKQRTLTWSLNKPTFRLWKCIHWVEMYVAAGKGSIPIAISISILVNTKQEKWVEQTDRPTNRTPWIPLRNRTELPQLRDRDDCRMCEREGCDCEWRGLVSQSVSQSAQSNRFHQLLWEILAIIITYSIIIPGIIITRRTFGLIEMI